MTRRHLARTIAATCYALSANSLGAVGPDALDAQLMKLGATVERFWKNIASVSCTERMEQLKIDPQKGKVLNSRTANYDYLVLLQMLGSDLRIEESRQLLSESKKKKIRRPSHRPLLITNGFALSLLIFHPRYQLGFAFTTLPAQEWNGREYTRIGFEHIRGQDSPSALMLDDRLYPLRWKGEALIDPATWQVARLVAELSEPLSEVGLERLEAEVDYAAVKLPATTMWMPLFARIEAATKRQLWRNSHEFADYRQFRVETDFRIDDIEEPAASYAPDSNQH